MKRYLLLLSALLIIAPANARDSETNTLVAQYDLNGNGKIDVPERKPFLKALRKLQRDERQRQLQAAFKAPRIGKFPAAWDTDRDGVVDADEQRQAALLHRREHPENMGLPAKAGKPQNPAPPAKVNPTAPNH